MAHRISRNLLGEFCPFVLPNEICEMTKHSSIVLSTYNENLRCPYNFKEIGLSFLRLLQRVSSLWDFPRLCIFKETLFLALLVETFQARLSVEVF